MITEFSSFTEHFIHDFLIKIMIHPFQSISISGQIETQKIMFVYQLCSIFRNFYENCYIIQDSDQKQSIQLTDLNCIPISVTDINTITKGIIIIEEKNFNISFLDYIHNFIYRLQRTTILNHIIIIYIFQGNLNFRLSSTFNSRIHIQEKNDNDNITIQTDILPSYDFFIFDMIHAKILISDHQWILDFFEECIKFNYSIPYFLLENQLIRNLRDKILQLTSERNNTYTLAIRHKLENTDIFPLNNEYILLL